MAYVGIKFVERQQVCGWGRQAGMLLYRPAAKAGNPRTRNFYSDKVLLLQLYIVNFNCKS